MAGYSNRIAVIQVNGSGTIRAPPPVGLIVSGRGRQRGATGPGVEDAEGFGMGRTAGKRALFVGLIVSAATRSGRGRHDQGSQTHKASVSPEQLASGRFSTYSIWQHRPLP